MAEAKAEATWDHTASLLAMRANCNRDPKTRPRPFTAADFNPFTTRRKRPLTAEEMDRALSRLAGEKRPPKPKLWDTLKADTCRSPSTSKTGSSTEPPLPND